MGQWFSKSTPPSDPVDIPGPVEGLEVVSNPARPSVTLRWRPPRNLVRNRGAIDICDLEFLIHVTEVGSSEIVDETRFKLNSYFGPMTFTYTRSSLAPLKEYSFKIVVDNKSLGVRGEPRCVQQFFGKCDCHHTYITTSSMHSLICF